MTRNCELDRKMVNIQSVVKMAIEKTRETEQLQTCYRNICASLDRLRKRNYPTNRGVQAYFTELPLLPSLLSENVRLLDIGAAGDRGVLIMPGQVVDTIQHRCQPYFS